MSNKELSKNIISSYHSTIIPICRLLKPHATNIMLLPENIILMQPAMNTVRSFMVLNQDIDFFPFLYTYFSIPEVSKINTKFKKTKSTIDWKLKDGVNYLVIKNEDMDEYETPIINNPAAVADIINATYTNLPNWSSMTFNRDYLNDESSKYSELPNDFLDDMKNKKLCEIEANGHTILLARPFLGDLKNTSSVEYMVVYEDDFKITLKFRQRESLGDIYTYASFLIV